MVNPLHGKTWVLIGFKWVDVSASPIFFCLETPGQDQVNHQVRSRSAKLNGFLRFAPFRIACKPSVPKVECLSTLEIECFLRVSKN